MGVIDRNLYNAPRATQSHGGDGLRSTARTRYVLWLSAGCGLAPLNGLLRTVIVSAGQGFRYGRMLGATLFMHPVVIEGTHGCSPRRRTRSKVPGSTAAHTFSVGFERSVRDRP